MRGISTLCALLTVLVAHTLWGQVPSTPPVQQGGPVIDEDFEGVTANWSLIHAAPGLNVPSSGWTTVDPFLPARPTAPAASRAWTVQNTVTAYGPDAPPAQNQTHWMEFGWYPPVWDYSVAAVSPSLNPSAAYSGAACLALSFTLRNDGWVAYPWAADETLEVWYVDNSASAPQWVRAFTRKQAAGDPGQSVTTEEMVLLPLNSTDLQIAFVCQGVCTNYFDTWLVDNILLRALTRPTIQISRGGAAVIPATTDVLKVSAPWAPQTPQTHSWQITNASGMADLHVSAIQVSNLDNCTVQNANSQLTVSPGSSSPLDFGFTPLGFGQFSCRVTVTSDDADNGTFWFDVVGYAALPGGTYDVGPLGEFADIGEAFEALEDCGILGAVVFEIAAGTYATDARHLLGLDGEFLAPVMGVSSLNSINFRAAAGAAPKLDGSFYTSYEYMGGSKCTLAISCPFVTIEGLEITGGIEAGIHVCGGTYPCQPWQPPTLQPANDVTIRGCTIHGIPNGMAVLATGAYSSLDGLLIENCAIYDCKTCYFPNFTSWYSHGMITLYNMGTNCRVNNNTLIQNSGVLYWPQGFSHDNHLAVIGGVSAGSLAMTNNIIASTIPSGTLLAFDWGGAPMVADNNVFYASSAINFSIDPLLNTFAQWQASGRDANGVLGNPGLNSLAINADIHLTANSIARNRAGTSAAAKDFEGDVRPMGGAADSGADEYREAEIDVSLNGSPLTSGTAVSLGNVPDSGQDFTFEIHNTELAALNISGVSVATISAGSTLQVPPTVPATLAAGASHNLVLHVVPAVGTFNFTVNIANDDANENPFSIVCDGTGVAAIPQMAVTEGGAAVTTGPASGGRAFGSRDVNLGATGFAVITIANSGYADLLLGTPTLYGTHAGEFVLDLSSLVTTVAAGSSTSFGVAFDPTSKGPKGAQVFFSHNDLAQVSPFTFSVSGTGIDPAGVTITTATLPNGRVTEGYSISLAATGGTTPYQWTLVSGNLPAGLALSNAGVISGTITGNDGTFNFTVRVTDANGGTEERPLSLLVTPGPGMVGGGQANGVGGTGGCTAANSNLAAAILLLLALIAALRRRSANA